jgi:hypothetical protein
MGVNPMSDLQESAVPNTLTEVDKLKLELVQVKRAHLNAEAQNLLHAQRALEEQRVALDAQIKALSMDLREAYSLSPGDEILGNGSIKRTAVRAIKEAPHE